MTNEREQWHLGIQTGVSIANCVGIVVCLILNSIVATKLTKTEPADVRTDVAVGIGILQSDLEDIMSRQTSMEAKLDRMGQLIDGYKTNEPRGRD